MNWAFWRAKEAAAAKAGADDAQDSAAELHVRTRRRLIGAAALLLTAVIVLPMVLDPTPRPVSDTVAIDIPSDKTPFTPRLSSPAPTTPAAAPLAPAAPPARADEAPKAESKPADEAGKATPPTASAAAPGAFALQAAALASETAARDLAAKLKKAGFAAYTEKVSTKQGDRIRVRVGPFATREDAEQARAKLKSIGIDAGVVNG